MQDIIAVGYVIFTYNVDNTIATEIGYTSPAMTTKTYEDTYAYAGGLLTSETIILYAKDGTTIKHTYTVTYTYDGSNRLHDMTITVA